LSPVGKPAPPRPRSAERFDLGDHLLGWHLLGDDFLQRVVAAARDIVGEPPVLAGESGHQDGVGPVVEELRGRVHSAFPEGFGLPSPRFAAAFQFVHQLRRASQDSSSCTYGGR